MTHELKAGFARRDITPPIGTYLAGYPNPNRYATGVRDRLAASALTLEQDGVRAVLVVLDLALADDAMVAEIRERASAATGIPGGHMIVAAIQTHSGPMTFDCFGWGTKNQQYVDWLVPLAVEAIVDAASGAAAATVGFGVTASDVGVNRRRVNEHGAIELSYNPWGPYDPEMIVVRFEGEQGTIATMINYGAHPTVLDGSSMVVSRDWPGVMIDRVEHLTGAPAFFVNGAVGDIAPRTNFNSCVGDGETALQETGTKAAMDAMRAFRSIRDFRAVDLGVVTDKLILPYGPMPTLEEARAGMAKLEPHKDEWGLPRCHYLHLQSVIETLGGKTETAKTVDHQIVTLGPLAMVPFPGEPFAETILRLKEASPFQHTVCLSTTNGNCGYFPTREAMARGGYEVEVQKAYGPYVLAPNIDDLLVRENLRLLRAASALRP